MAGLFEKFKTQVVNSAISAVSSISPYKIEEMKSEAYLTTYAKYQKLVVKDEAVLYKVANHHEMIYFCHEDSSTEHLVFNLFRIQSYEEAMTIFDAYANTITVIAMSSKCVRDKKWLERICNTQREHLAYRPAHVAAALGLVECLQNELIQRMINEQDGCTLSTPLHVAIATRNIPFALGITELSGVQYELPDAQGNTVLHLATQNNDPDLLQTLLGKCRRSVNSLNVAGKSSLLIACELGAVMCVDALLASGADCNITCCDVHPIHAAMKIDALDCVAKLCAQNPSTVNVQDPREGCTALFHANTKKAVFFLADLSANLDVANVQGVTPLHAAVRRGCFEVAYALLLRGADANIADTRGNAPLHTAIQGGNIDLVRALIVFEANVNAVNVDGESPRHITAAAKNRAKRDVLLYTLHAVGAAPCRENMSKCWNGCRFGTTFSGVPPPVNVADAVYEPLGSEQLLQTAEAAPGGERLLCLDGGGIRGLILIQMLRALERCCAKPLHELFDWVAGTSTGGILALCITHKRPLRVARSLYFTMKDDVFSGKRPYETTALERVMKAEFGEHTMMTDVATPRVMVTGLLADRFPPQLHIFRNYLTPKTDTAESPSHSKFTPLTRPDNQLVWRAARASGAAPTFFRACGRFLDGGLIANNPTLDALTEIHEFKVAQRSVLGEKDIRPLGLVLSLGCGQIPLTQVTQIDICRPQTPLDALRAGYGISSLVKILVEMATASEGRVVERARAWCHMAGIGFHRFSPPISSDVPLDCTDNGVLLQMLWETEVYLHRHQEALLRVASLLS